MSSLKTNILVISYYFPPYNRVGGRRWAKHTKYLNRPGENVYVLTGAFPNSSSPWDDDIVEYKDKITRISLEKLRKPYFETTLPKNILSKVRWKLSYHTRNITKRFLKGNYEDVSTPNKKLFYEEAKELVEKKSITHVIISIGPFSYSEIIIDLKKDFPTVKFIVDYRDPWEESISKLNERQKSEELKKQLNLLKTVDLVLTVNDDISQHIRNVYDKVKVVTIPHGVDEDFLKLSEKISFEKRSDNIKFMYGGELYAGLKHEIQTFVDFFNAFSRKVSKECLADFYSPYPSYENILCTNKNINLSSMLLKDQYHEKLIEADFILLFKSPLSSESFFSSKFYEILCMRKPILFFGKPGMVSEYIAEHQLGYHITENKINEMCVMIIQNMADPIIPSRNYNLQKHSFESHTKKLIEEIKQII